MGSLLNWNPDDDFQCLCESHGGGMGEYYLDKICKECSAGYLLQHPEWPKWLKCTICGFCTVETAKKSQVETISWEVLRELESEDPTE